MLARVLQSLKRTAALLPMFLQCGVSADGLSLSPPSRSDTAFRARVVIAHDAAAMEVFRPNAAVVETLVRDGLLRLTGRTNLAEAWSGFVATNERVAIKVHAAPGASSGTRVPVVEAVVRGLIASGVTASNITVWDRRLDALRQGGFDAMAARHGIRLAGAVEAGFDRETFYENPIPGTLVFGDLEFSREGSVTGRKSHLTRVVTEADKHISVVPLVNHNDAGVAGHLLNLALGSVDNALRFEGRTDRMLSAVPEIYGQPAIADRAVLHITDALLCQYQGEQRSLLHYSVPLGQLWFSTDPVALDVLALAELERQRDIAKMPAAKIPREIYGNAELLELGVANPRRIRVEAVP